MANFREVFCWGGLFLGGLFRGGFMSEWYITGTIFPGWLLSGGLFPRPIVTVKSGCLRKKIASF